MKNVGILFITFTFLLVNIALTQAESCGNGVCESGEGEDSDNCQVDCAESTTDLAEQIKCVFKDTDRTQECWTYIDDNGFKCKGVGSCIVDVFGSTEQKVLWKSSCGSYATTKLDGESEYAEFSCKTNIGQPGIEVMKEEVKCVFKESDKEQECYTLSSQGGFKCKGIDSCVIEVAGFQGEKLTWKSSCGGYTYTVVNGESEYAEFSCGFKQNEEVKERVKCIFKGDVIPVVPSDREDFISQVPNTQTVSEPMVIPDPSVYTNLDYEKLRKATILHRKHYTCDGRQIDEELGFGREEVINLMATGYTNYVCRNRYQEQCIDDGSFDTYYDEWCEYGTSENPIPEPPTEVIQECYTYTSKGKASCFGVKTCVADVTGMKGEKLVWKSSCGGYAYTFLDGYDDYAEFSCGEQESQIQEQVKCIFKGATSEQECYSYDDKNEKVGCKGLDTCVVDVSGKKGSKLIWKSSCGGYAFTLLDGESEYAEFSCSSGIEVKEEEIKQKGFEYAYWQCYDGSMQVSEKSCKSSETWKKYAESDCAGLCNNQNECGVKEFSVAKDCYEKKKNKEIVKDDLSIFKEETKIEALICKDSCPSDGKCYPFGYRKAGQFCSDKGSFEPQWKSGTQCENNFECDSNVCVSGQCLSQSFIQKITVWFEKIFGKEE